MSAAIAVCVSPRERQCRRFQASPSRVDVWDGRTEKTKKYWHKSFEPLMATVEQEDPQCR